MTVCIAARSGGVIVGASDRMITGGDIQFEPSSMKTEQITSSIAIMVAGDAVFAASIIPRIKQRAFAAIKANPQRWLPVIDVTKWIVEERTSIKRELSERALLGPLGLDARSFVDAQKTMNGVLVEKLTRDLIGYELPYVSFIVCGIDDGGPAIYVVDNDSYGRQDPIGFASIGNGSRHASSQFMLARHAFNSPLSDTLLLTYVAKKRAEVAPGVGRATDMFMIGSSPGTLSFLSDEVMQRLDAQYKKIEASERRAFEKSKAEMKQYVDSIVGAVVAQQQEGGNGGGDPTPGG